MTCLPINTPCRSTRRKAIALMAAAPLLPFVVPDTLSAKLPEGSTDPDEQLDLPMDARFIARWQRMAWRESEQGGYPLVSALEVVNLDARHRAYVACGERHDVDELGALMLAMIEGDGLGERITDAYRTVDGRAAAVVVELKGGAR